MTEDRISNFIAHYNEVLEGGVLKGGSPFDSDAVQIFTDKLFGVMNDLIDAFPLPERGTEEWMAIRKYIEEMYGSASIEVKKNLVSDILSSPEKYPSGIVIVAMFRDAACYKQFRISDTTNVVDENDVNFLTKLENMYAEIVLDDPV